MERSFDWLWDKYKEGARGVFEEICYKVYKKQFPNAEVKRIRVTKGDGGIDVYVEYSTNYTVVQCKFFRREVGKSQKSQIRDSFKSVDKSGLTEWILCIPIILSEKEANWWRKWKKKQEDECGITIKLHDEDDLIDLMKNYDLYDEYFETVRLDKNILKNNVIDNEKLEFRKILNPVVYLVSEGITSFELIQEISKISHFSTHKFFEKNGMLHYLEELSWYISINNDVPKPENYDEQLLNLRKLVLDEYQKLDLSY